MPEQAPSTPDDATATAVRAAEDQAIAAARHVADCVVRYYRVLVEGELPPGLVARLTRDWHQWFVCDTVTTDDDDDE